MDTLDTLVTDHLVTELRQPDRLRATLSSLWSSCAEKSAQVVGRVSALRGEVTGAEEKLKRLYRMVEEGVTDLDEILNDPLAVLKEQRDRSNAALDRIHVAEHPPAEIAPELIERFGRLMRENVTTGEAPSERRGVRHSSTTSGSERTSSASSATRPVWRRLSPAPAQ